MLFSTTSRSMATNGVSISSMRMAAPSVLHFDDQLDLDGAVAGKLVETDSRPGVPTRVRAEQLEQQIGGAVDHRRGVVEPLRAVHHAEQLDHLGDLVQVADPPLHCS